jgi:hypothetical protein
MPSICSKVLGQQQSLNAVSSQVAKELQSLQQKDGRDVVDCAGVCHFQTKSKQIQSSCTNTSFSEFLPYSGLRDNVYVDVRGARITHAEKT